MKQIVTVFALSVAAFGFVRIDSARAEDKKAADDTTFVTQALNCNQFEVKLAELAKERATNPDVLKFAERMIDDHSKANKDLMGIADKMGVKAPRDLDKKHQEVWDQLKDLKGAEFDRAYMRQMVKGHEEATEQFSKWSRDARNDQVKEYASKTLPHLKEHLQQAREIHKKLENKQ